MSALKIELPFPIFTGIDGDPLEDGYVYIGQSGLNAESNPIQAYWDSALTIPAAQPIRTIGGYASQSGAPGKLYVDAANFSILVRNKNNTLIWSDTDGTGISPNSDNVDFLQAGTGAVTRSVQDKLRDTVSAEDFGATGDGVTDDAAAIQLAINTGKNVTLREGTFVIGSELVSSTAGQHLFGSGEGATTLLGSNASGAVIRFKNAYSGIHDVSIASTGSRASATNTTGKGIHFEPNDVARDPVTLEGYLYNTHISGIEVTDQPSDGLYIAGGVLNGSTIDRFRLHSNRGHGIHIERGYTRANPGDAIGLCNINHGIAFGNDGHGVALGNPNDTATTQTIRVQINNVDTGDNALAAGVRFDAHQNWITGTGLNWLDCYASDSQGTPTTGGLFVQGTNNHVTSFRTNDVDPAVEVGQNVAALFTNSTYITALNVLTTDIADLDPAVVVSANAKNTYVFTKDYGNITTLVGPNARGLALGSDTVTFKKTSDQSVNNSTTLTGVQQMEYYATDNEEGYFELFLEFTSVAAAHLKLDFVAPAGTQFRWCTSDGRLKDTAGAQADQLVLTSASSTISTFADTNRRSIFIKGFFRTTGTAGAIQPRFAQDTAQVGDTTIKTPTSYFRVEKVAPLN